MSPHEIDDQLLRSALDAVGAHLEARGERVSVVVVGGAALALRGWVSRTTHDVDVLATTSTEPPFTWEPPKFSEGLREVTRRVARDFNLQADWFNAVIGAQWVTGLPEWIDADLEWLKFRALRVGVVGRQALVALKLIAAVDQWPESVHLQDLGVLRPTDQELHRAREWVLTQDVSPVFESAVDMVIEHVRQDR